jgi:nucleotide-binding universal stress UspA family protein
VIGTHGRRGASRLFLGSVSESILRIAPAPVLLIRGK